MSSSEIHQAGVTLEDIVGRLDAKLRGNGAHNHANYHDDSKGVFDGIAACLEVICANEHVHELLPQVAGKSGARFRVGLERAIRELQAIDPQVEDPARTPMSVTALVSLLLALEALYEHVASG